MLVLREITKKDNIISADYYPENSIEGGHIEVDLSTEDICFLEKAKGYEYSSAPAHALNALLQMKTLETMPRERKIMWY